MRTRLWTISLVATVLALPLAAAEECPTVETTADTGDTPEGRYYVVVDECTFDPTGGCLFSVWVYKETNGEPGLQRPSDDCDGGDYWEGA